MLWSNTTQIVIIHICVIFSKRTISLSVSIYSMVQLSCEWKYSTTVNCHCHSKTEESKGCNYTPTHRQRAILQSPCLSVCLSVRPSVHTFVTDISASTGRNDFIFDMWLWHGDLYRVSPFQVYCTSTSCLPCDLRIFHVFTSFSGNECWDIYKFYTNEWVGVFLAQRSVQHLVIICKTSNQIATME